MQLDEPVECTSGGDPLPLYKILHLLFFRLVEILCALCLARRKNLPTCSWCGTFGISVSLAKGMSHQPIQNCVAFLGVIGKTPGLISCNNFVKKTFVCIGHHNNVLARCDSIFPLLRCQGVWDKTCTQLSLSQILFQNLKNYSLGDVQIFCYHSWCNSMVIFDQIGTAAMFTSVQVDFGWPPLLSFSTAPFHLEIKNTA